LIGRVGVYERLLRLRQKILERFFIDLMLGNKNSSKNFLRREKRIFNKTLYLLDKYWFKDYYYLVQKFRVSYGCRVFKFNFKKMDNIGLMKSQRHMYDFGDVNLFRFKLYLNSLN